MLQTLDKLTSLIFKITLHFCFNFIPIVEKRIQMFPQRLRIVYITLITVFITCPFGREEIEKPPRSIRATRRKFRCPNTDIYRYRYIHKAIYVYIGFAKRCKQIWRTQQWPQDWKMSVFILTPKKGNPKECSNYRTIARISHPS